MAQKYRRVELVARLVRAGELEVSGEHPDEVGDYFAPGFKFDGAGGFESDYDGLQDYFGSSWSKTQERPCRSAGVTVW
jgi:hypothetical protein